MKCIVNGCSQDAVGATILCLPCFNMLKDGKVSEHGNTFIHHLRDDCSQWRNEARSLLTRAKDGTA